MLVFGNGFKLTTKGKQMVSSGASYSFSKIVLGAGTYTSAEDATTRTALKAQKQSFDVSDTAIDGSTVTIAGVITNASLSVGYTITEAGVIAKDSTGTEHLFLIGVATLSDPMPAHNDNIPDVVCDMKIKYTTSNTSKVSLSVPETAFARAIELKEVNSKLAQTYNELSQTKINRNEANVVSLEMFTTEAKTAMTGGSVAVVGSKSVGPQQLTTNLQKDINKVSEISVPWENGRYYPGTAAEINEDAYRRCSIACTEGDRFVLSNCIFGTKYEAIQFVKSDGSFISMIADDLPLANRNDYEFMCPRDSSFIKITILHNVNYKPVLQKYVLDGIGNKNMQENFMLSLPDNINIKDLFSLTVGTMDNYGHSWSILSNFNNRIVSGTWTTLPFDIDIKLSDYGKYRYFYIINTSGTFVNSGWITHDTTIEKGNTIKLCFARTEGTETLISNLLNDELYKSIEIYSLKNSTIPTFLKNHTDNKSKEVSDKIQSVGASGDAFVFLTDIHVGANRMFSPYVIKKIIENTNINKVICGGDIPESFITPATLKKQMYLARDIFEKTIGNKMYYVKGNHEGSIIVNSGGTNTVQYPMTESEVYSILFKGVENRSVPDYDNLKGMYYYFDNNAQKIRYICLNNFEVGTDKSGIISADEAHWLAYKALNLPSDGWTVCVIIHGGIKEETAGSSYWGSGSATRAVINGILEAFQNKTTYNYVWNRYNINVNYTDADGKIAFVLCGHVHSDNIVIDNNIVHVSTTCDALYQDDGYGRTEGTISEIAFDVVCIDKKNSRVDLIRIGAGANRAFTYGENATIINLS